MIAEYILGLILIAVCLTGINVDAAIKQVGFVVLIIIGLVLVLGGRTIGL